MFIGKGFSFLVVINIAVKQKRAQILFCTLLQLWLTRQGSNLDSSEPKSDVLPVTPRVSPYVSFR